MVDGLIYSLGFVIVVACRVCLYVFCWVGLGLQVAIWLF